MSSESKPFQVWHRGEEGFHQVGTLKSGWRSDIAAHALVSITMRLAPDKWQGAESYNAPVDVIRTTEVGDIIVTPERHAFVVSADATGFKLERCDLNRMQDRVKFMAEIREDVAMGNDEAIKGRVDDETALLRKAVKEMDEGRDM